MQSAAKSALIVGLLGLGSQAAAVVVDFENGQTCSSAEVSITAGVAGESCTYSANGMDWSNAIKRSSARGDAFWTAEFAGTASDISVHLGDRSRDDDRLFLRAYDSNGGLLGEVTHDSLGLNNENHRLSLSVTGAASATFGVLADLGAGSGIFADGLEFTLSALRTESETGSGVTLLVDNQPSPVPLPAAGWLMALGLVGLGAARRRR